MKTNLEFLLEEAKKRYPVGTIYWNLDLIGGRSNTYFNAKPIKIKYPAVPHVAEKNYKGHPVIARGGTQGYVYSGGVWAEIVRLPYEKQIELW